MVPEMDETASGRATSTGYRPVMSAVPFDGGPSEISSGRTGQCQGRASRPYSERTALRRKHRPRHREDDKCWWCEGTAAQTREHVFRHCSRWRDQQKMLWKAVGKVTGWKAGRCRHVQISELFTMEECDQAVIDFLAATDVGKFPPK